MLFPPSVPRIAKQGRRAGKRVHVGGMKQKLSGPGEMERKENKLFNPASHQQQKEGNDKDVRARITAKRSRMVQGLH
jgi:hypothetical protein